MADLEITGGAEALERVARRLKDAGEVGLRRELLAAIRKAAKPIPAAAKASALDKLPRRGGLAARVAASRIGIRTRTTGRNVGIRVEAKGLYNLRRMDAGTVRHPDFGNRDRWFSQPVPEGWFSKPAEAAAGDVRGEIEDAMNTIADRIGGGA